MLKKIGLICALLVCLATPCTYAMPISNKTPIGTRLQDVQDSLTWVNQMSSGEKGIYRATNERPYSTSFEGVPIVQTRYVFKADRLKSIFLIYMGADNWMLLYNRLSENYGAPDSLVYSAGNNMYFWFAKTHTISLSPYDYQKKVGTLMLYH